MDSSEQSDNENFEHIFELPVNSNKLTKLDLFIIQNHFDSFTEFAEYFQTNSQHSRCALSWNNMSISCSCADCQINSNSCSCVNCFLEGPHKHHKCHVHISTLGNCDCGDYSSWKQKGTCKTHSCQKNSKGNDVNSHNFEYDDNDDNYFIPNVTQRPNSPLPIDLRKRLISALKAARKDVDIMIEKENFFFFSEYCHWLLKFCKLGDEINNCVAEAINDVEFIKKVLLGSQNMTKDKMYSFFLLCGALTNHCSFSTNFLDAIVQVLPSLLNKMREISVSPLRITSNPPMIGMLAVVKFNYQYFCNYPISYLTTHNKFDWIRFILFINELFINFFLAEETFSTFLNFDDTFRILMSYRYILRAVLRIESEMPKMKYFLIEFCKSVEKIEGFSHTELDDNSQNNDALRYSWYMGKIPHLINKKMQYFVPEVVDIFIWHLLNDKYQNERNALGGYSLFTYLHQIFISHMLKFNLTSEIESRNDDKLFNVCYKGSDPKDTFNYYCILNLKKSNQITDSNGNINELINSIYLKAIELPMISIAVHYLFNFGLKPLKGPRRIIDNIYSHHRGETYKTYVLPRHIALVQTIFSFTEKENKDEMIKFIAKTIGAFQADLTIDDLQMRDFAFVLFISILILDRDCINDDTVSICLKNLMTRMKYESIGLSEFSSIIRPIVLPHERFQAKYDAMNIDTDWNLILPCINDISQLYISVIPSIIGNAEDTLLPFPEFSDPNNSSGNDSNNECCSNLLLKNLDDVFESKYIFASIFSIIYDYNNDKVIIQYALNLFITFAQNSKEANQNDDLLNKPIYARTVDELASKIQTNNFRLFANMKIGFKGNKEISLVQLIDNLGVIGITSLSQVGLSNTTNKKSKKKLQQMKQRIIKGYKMKREKYASTIDQKSLDCCSICHKNKNKNDSDLLYIPITFFDSVSIDLFDDISRGQFNPEDEKTYEKEKYIRRQLSFNFIHKECSNNYHHDKIFLMPKIDHLPLNFGSQEKINDKEMKILSEISTFLSESKLGGQAFQFLSQMIFVLDFRSRLNLEVLDDPSVVSLYSNLFRNCIFSIGFYSLCTFRNELERVIYDCFQMLFKNDFSEENDEYLKILEIREKEKIGKISLYQFLFSKIVQTYASSSKRLDEYLRRCYLIEKFYICDKTDINDGFVDWDFYLNFNVLYSHFYHTKQKQESVQTELPVYRGIDLPEYFLHLFYPPFKASSISIDSLYCICIFTGEILKRENLRQNKLGLPFTVVLNLYGSSVGSISIRSLHPVGRTLRGLSIYVDKNGFEDPGFQRGSNLVLSRKRYDKLIDAFLSGDILDSSYIKHFFNT